MRKTAKRLGEMLGLDSKEVNKKLAEIGYLQGEPGNWALTEQGAQHGEVIVRDNGYGGYTARSWDYIVWDPDVANKLGDPAKHLKEVNRNRRAAGLPIIKSWDDKT